MRPVRLLHVYKEFPAKPSPWTARTVALINHFGVRAEHVLLCAEPVDPAVRQLVKPRIRLDVAQAAPAIGGRFSVARYKALAAYMRAFHLVLSHQHDTLDLALARTLFAGQMRLPPVVHHEHGLAPEEQEKSKVLRKWYRILALARTDALIVPNADLAATALSDWKQPQSRVQRVFDPRAEWLPSVGTVSLLDSAKRSEQKILAQYMAIYGRAMRRRDFGEWDE